MYRFKYQHVDDHCYFIGSEHFQVIPHPVVTCIVPANWLSQALPVMGGWVVYQDASAKTAPLTAFVFEFEETEPGRTFNFKIRLTSAPTVYDDDCREVFNKAIQVSYVADPGVMSNEKMHAGILLLNHLMCNFAGSALTGVSFVDIYDVLNILAPHTNFILKCGIGLDPKAILGKILVGLGDISSASAYPVIYGRYASMLLEHFGEITSLQVKSGLAYAPAVDDDRFLISLLLSQES